MPQYRVRNRAHCKKYGMRCVRYKDCLCPNKHLECRYVRQKRRKECVGVSIGRFGNPLITSPRKMCHKFQRPCYHDNECKCEYSRRLRCRQVNSERLCLAGSEEFPSWSVPKPPATTQLSTVPTSTTTPTDPADNECKRLYKICEEETDCLCEHSDELRCFYNSDMEVNQCMESGDWNPTQHPPTRNQARAHTTRSLTTPESKSPKEKGAYISFISYGKVKVDIPVQSLHEIIGEEFELKRM